MNNHGIIFMGMIFIFNSNYLPLNNVHSNYLPLNKVHSNYLRLNNVINKPSLKHYPKNISSIYK